MIATGQNPNELDRKPSSAELTIGQALVDYCAYISTRAKKPAMPNPPRVFDRAVQKMRGFGWIDKKVRDIPADETESKFLANNIFKTANEQTFRWTMAAVGWCIKKARLVASAERREPTMEATPFDILAMHNRFRSKDSLEKECSLSAARNLLVEQGFQLDDGRDPEGADLRDDPRPRSPEGVLRRSSWRSRKNGRG